MDSSEGRDLQCFVRAIAWHYGPRRCHIGALKTNHDLRSHPCHFQARARPSLRLFGISGTFALHGISKPAHHGCVKGHSENQTRRHKCLEVTERDLPNSEFGRWVSKGNNVLFVVKQP